MGAMVASMVATRSSAPFATAYALRAAHRDAPARPHDPSPRDDTVTERRLEHVDLELDRDDLRADGRQGQGRVTGTALSMMAATAPA